MANRTVEIVFDKLPETVDELNALLENKQDNEFEVAAITVAVLCMYPKDKDTCIAMLNVLKGPKELTPYEIQFLRDRFMDKDYVPRSFFKGATPDNDYQASAPYTVAVEENPYTYADEGYAKLYLTSGGADSPRPVQLRLAKDGKWYLWEQFLLSDIRPPESSNPWA